MIPRYPVVQQSAIGFYYPLFYFFVIITIFPQSYTATMPLNQQQHITRLLNEISEGNKQAIDEVLPVIYKELKVLSSNCLNREYKRSSIQTTELVHEAYLKLVDIKSINWESRTHFFCIAAKTMRQILVDLARNRKAQKRGGGKTDLSLDEALSISGETNDNILVLDEALKKLEAIENRSCRIVELRYFAGLTIKETADVLNISVTTVKRDWNFAKAWLYREIGQH